ncbi:GTP 3',8-cyclase MoaA [Brevibacillus sp. SYSU BS000544]|uniref:GTP 3',8-cyclase MoaA n=1 Tax=Brevibacillus sp. SYSU BS000544 TaxID=3416443 RepID=UPI003CE5643A
MTDEKLVDRFGRIHDYLRISVTDRCNLRCVYCMPAEGVEFQPHSCILRFEEIVEVVKHAASLGVKRLRLTGGEPLVRKDIEKLVYQLASINEIEDIALTTNGIFLAQKAKVLKDVGLNRVNISLDTMKSERYLAITRGGELKRVLEAIEASIEVGFSPIKLNVVLMRGINDDEVNDFLRLTMHWPINVRFIEFMPIGETSDEWRSRYLPLSTVLESAKEMGFTDVKKDSVFGNGPSENYRLPNAVGTFGLIHPVSDHFCNNCNRLRLTADGNLKSCLYWQDEVNVRSYINNPMAMKQLFYKVISAKPENHEMAQAFDNQEPSHTPTSRRMSQIGG